MADSFDKGIIGEEQARNLLVRIFHAAAKQFAGTQDKGIDLTIQFTPPFNNSLLNIGVQVKSGKSYIESETDKHWKFKYQNHEQLEKIKTYSVLPVMLIWVDLETSKSYWTVITTNTSPNSILISKKNELSPLTLFDFLHKYYKINYRATISNDFSVGKLPQPLRSKYGILESGKTHYKNLKKTFLGVNSGKAGTFKNPTIGEIIISKHGWRVMTRAGRKKYFIANSIELLRDLDRILEMPSKLTKIETTSRTIRGKYVYENRRLILRIPDVIISGSSKSDIILALSEQIVFDVNWKENLNFYFETKRRVSFENIYEKKRTTL